jgi:hypothetical protein
MRIGVFTATNKKLAIVLCQLAPADCPCDEENYPGTDPSERIQEIEDAGYKVLTVWWKDIKHDPKRLFTKAMLDFEIANKSFMMH